VSQGFDFSEVQALAVSLGRVSSAVVGEARQVVAKAALNVKEDTRKNISKNDYWKRLEHKVNYDLVGLTAVVGYDDTGQGELAGIYEFGSSRRAPHPTLYPAAEREAPRFEKALGDIAGKALGDLL
jgi:hypothetical protein